LNENYLEFFLKIFPQNIGKIEDKTPKINSVSGKLEIEMKTSFYSKRMPLTILQLDLEEYFSVRRNFFSNREINSNGKQA